MAQVPEFHMPDAAWEEAQRARQRWRSHIAVGLLALLVGVGATLGAQAIAEQHGTRSEQAAHAAAVAYLHALETGDDAVAEASLLDSAERAAAPPSSIAQEGRLRGPRITSVALGDGTAQVRISYAVADRTVLRRIDMV
ncbi:hypothetical protein FV289_23065, partial [Escherichia coli]|uniref:hypothetical protein n=1 Tax=Escherichia coli TaxID=562 RepID=UPI0011C77E02